MVKSKEIFFLGIILFFLFLSFFPTFFELSQAKNLADKRREFILEHNYYWPDFNLYLSKIRQGYEGKFLAQEKYTSEPHQGSLIQVFYLSLGFLGRIFSLEPNFSYQLGRIILSPLLLLIVLLFAQRYFPSFFWQISAFLIVLTSGSFPRFYFESQKGLKVGRFMEWWSNIDALQRLTFLPHILFGQVVSFFLLYLFTAKEKTLTRRKFLFSLFLGNLLGLVFPPSLMTLSSVLLFLFLLDFFRKKRRREKIFSSPSSLFLSFVIFTSPSLFYLFFLTKIPPWSALVDYHRTHPMMIPFDQYVLGTGPIFFLGIAGSFLAILKRESRFQPLILWVLTTFSFASFFSLVKEQSPLRFTQTGLFLPLGILTTYFFQKIFSLPSLKKFFLPFLTLFLLSNFFMLKVSLNWQLSFIRQRVAASLPLVPYPPQTMYPLKNWMEGIRWLRDNTNHQEVVLAEFTAANFLPAYSGHFVYFGQANTLHFERKREEVDQFFSGKMSPFQVKNFLANGRIKYIFFSHQEKEKTQGKPLEVLYPFLNLKPLFTNSDVIIYEL